MCGGFRFCKKDEDGGGGGSGDSINAAEPSNAESGLTLYESIIREERELRPPAIPGLVEGRRRRIRRLHSRTGFDVAMYPNGKIRGTTAPKNKYGSFVFEIAGRNGELRIKGVMTEFYITMTPKGRIIGQPVPELNGTVWIEARASTHSPYMTFLSRDYAHLGWYFAIKKSGKPKAGHKTNSPYPQKSISFLTYVVAEEYY